MKVKTKWPDRLVGENRVVSTFDPWQDIAINSIGYPINLYKPISKLYQSRIKAVSKLSLYRGGFDTALIWLYQGTNQVQAKLVRPLQWPDQFGLF